MPFPHAIILDESAAHNLPLGLFVTAVVEMQRDRDRDYSEQESDGEAFPIHWRPFISIGSV
jgi:hypothetical protein